MNQHRIFKKLFVPSLHITSKHALQTYQIWEICSANQPTSDQRHAELEVIFILHVKFEPWEMHICKLYLGRLYSSPMYYFNLLRHSNCAILERTSWLVLNPMPSSLVATQCLQVIYLGFMTNSVGHTKSCVLCTFHNNIACHYSQVGRSLRRTLRSWKLRFLDQSRRPLEKICERAVPCNMMFLDCGVQSTPDWIRPVSF